MLNVNALEEIFLVGSRHTHEERKRQEHSRDEEGDNGPGPGPVDLDSGRIVIMKPAGDDPPARPVRPTLRRDR